MIRAVCYPRVSDAIQRERDTIASQLRVLPEYVARQGWTLVRPAETYVDDGHSAAAGKLERRTGLAALLRDAGAGAFDVVAVVDVDRLTRTDDLIERGYILGSLQRAGVKIASQMSGQVIDLSTSDGDLLIGIQAHGAAAWLRRHRERVTQGRITAAARGRLPGGRRPWGLAYDRVTGAWSVDPVRGPLVVEMVERIAAGASCRSVADLLEARGVSREGGRWHASRVAAIVRSRHLVGEWRANRDAMIAVPRLVPDELWHAAQAIVDRARKAALVRTKHEYLLLGIAVCGACGSPMGIRSARDYFCRARRLALRGAPGRCSAPGVPIAVADGRAWAAIRRELEDPGLERALAGELVERGAEGDDWAADAAGYRGKLDRLQAAEVGLLERFTRGVVGGPALDRELERIAASRKALTAQLETAERAAASAGVTAGQLADAAAMVAALRERLPDAPFAARRQLLGWLVHPGDAVILGGDLTVTLSVPRPACQASGSVRGTGHEDTDPIPLRIRAVA